MVRARAPLAFAVAAVVWCRARRRQAWSVHFTIDVPEPVPVLRLAQGPAGDLLTGPIYIVAGLIAWRRRPENRIGPMMVVLGNTIVLPWVIGAAGTLGFTLATVVDDVSPVIGLLVFLVVSHGTPRAPAGANRRPAWVSPRSACWPRPSCCSASRCRPGAAVVPRTSR